MVKILFRKTGKEVKVGKDQNYSKELKINITKKKLE